MMNNNYEMIDVTDSIIPEENQKYFNDEESIELYNTCIHLMEEFITDNPTLVSEPDFEDVFDENIQELMYSQFEFDVFYTEDAEDEMNDIIKLEMNFFPRNHIKLENKYASMSDNNNLNNILDNSNLVIKQSQYYYIIWIILILLIIIGVIIILRRI